MATNPKSIKATTAKILAKSRQAIRPNGLNLRQQRFITEYLKHGNATQAAKDAGYTPKTAKQQGARLLTNADVSSQIAQKMSKSTVAAGLTVERLDQEIARLAYSDPRKLYDDKGRLKPIHELDDDTAASVASIEMITRGRRGRTRLGKVKLWGKTEALMLAARRLGALQDRLTVSGSVSLEMIVKASLPGPAAPPAQQNGDGAKVIEGEAVTVTTGAPADTPSNGQPGK